MRFIQKSAQPPQSIAAFLQNQLPIGVNLDYEHGFGRQPQLRGELVAEQFGLCAYTGAPIDDRITSLQPPPGAAARVRYLAHNEHLKPQSVCRQELVDRGLEPGRDLGEDMDHRNIVAALLVEGSSKEQFGAAVRGDQPFPVWPTHPNCETKFRFDREGRITGTDPDGTATIEVLHLHHKTLNGWRLAALDVFLAPEVVTSRQDLQLLINRLSQPQNDRLVEYSFCIKSVAESML